MFKAFRHIEDIEPSDPWWKKEVLDKVGDKLKGGYFDEKNKENNNLSFGKVKRLSRRAVEFCSKSRSAKKDYGFIVIERLDLEGLEDAVDRGLTASNYHEGIKQHIEFKGDVRCKPDRGTFLCKIPKLETIFAFCPTRKRNPTLDGFLVIVEYVKREQQHIQGTSYTWIHTERDFSNQWCYPLAVISYRDQKAPPPPAPKKRYSREQDSAVVKSERRSRSRSPSDRRGDRSRERDRDHREHRDRDRDRYHRDKRDRSREREHRGGSQRDRDDGYRIKKERRDDDYRESRRDEDYRRRSERDSHHRDRKEKYDQDDRRGSVSSNDKRWPGENSFDGPPNYERRGSSYSQDMNSSFNNQNPSDGHGQNGFDGHQNRVPPSNGHYHGNNYPGGPSGGYRPNHRMPIRPGYHPHQGTYGHGNPHYNNMRMPHGNGQMHNPRGPRPGMDRSMSTPNSHAMSPDGIPTPDNFPRGPHPRGPPNDGFTPNRGRFPSTGGFPNSPGFQGSPHSSAAHISPPGPPGRPELARRHSEQFNKVPNANQNLLTVPLASPNPAQMADGRKDHFCREYVKTRLERVSAKRKAITYWSGKLAFGEDEIDASLMHYTDPDMLLISECYLRFSKLKPLLFNDLSSEIIKLHVTITKPKKSMHKSFAGMWSCYPAYIQNSPENQENINKVFDRDTRACLSEVTTSKMIVFLVKSDQGRLRDLLNWDAVSNMMPDDSIPGFFFIIFTPLSNIKEFTQVQRANREIDLVHPHPLDHDGPGVNPLDPSYEAVQHMMGNLSMNIQHEDKYFHKDYRANWNINHDIILQLQKMTHSQKGHHQTVQQIATRISHTRYSQIPQLLKKFIDVIAEYEIFVKMDEILAEAIREEKQKRQAASDAAANPPTAPSTTMPNQNSTNLSSSNQPPKQPAPDKPRPQLNLQPLTLPQVHATQIPEILVPQTPPSTRVVSQQPQEKAPVPYVPSPKVRKLDRADPNVQEKLRIEQLNKEAQLMMLLQAAAAKDNGAKLLKGLSFAEAILLIDKNNVKIHPPADPTFEEHYENCLMNILRSEDLYLSKDFLEGKELRRTRDKDYNPTVEFSIPRSVLNEKTPNVDPHKHNELKTLLLNALPRMKDAPEERQQSQVRIDERRPNFTRTVDIDDPNRFSHVKKLNLANMAIIRATKNNIKRLRLGQQQIVELMEEEDDSDEDDRKGGMKTEDINKWLTDIEDCWSEIDRITDYPRFSEGPKKGEILENYLLEVNKIALEEYNTIMSMPPPKIPGEEGEDKTS